MSKDTNLKNRIQTLESEIQILLMLHDTIHSVQKPKNKCRSKNEPTSLPLCRSKMSLGDNGPSNINYRSRSLRRSLGSKKVGTNNESIDTKESSIKPYGEIGKDRKHSRSRSTNSPSATKYHITSRSTSLTSRFSDNFQDEITFEVDVSCKDERLRKQRKDKQTSEISIHQEIDQKVLEEAYKRMETLQAQITCANAQVELINADRAMLVKLLDIMKPKYNQLKVAYKQVKITNENLKMENILLCKNLQEEFNLQSQHIKKYQQCHQHFKETSENISKCKQNYEEKIEKYVNEREHLNKQIQHQNDEIALLQKEKDVLLSELANEKRSSLIFSNEMEERLRSMIHLEQEAKSEIKTLKTKIKKLQQMNDEGYMTDIEFEELRCECAILKQQLTEMSHQDDIKCRKIEQELQNFTNMLTQKEKMMLDEREELTRLVQELSDVVNRHKKRISQLVEINKQQESLLYSQSFLLQSKEEQVQMAEMETKSIKLKTTDLEKQLLTLHLSIDNFDQKQICETNSSCKCGVEVLQSDLIQTRTVLQDERDKLRIKEKIIEDQADTIKNLKSNIGEQNSYMENVDLELVRLQQELVLEKETKAKLFQDIAEIEQQRYDLSKQANLTEYEEQHIDINMQKLADQEKLLKTLEEYVMMKQRDWQAQCDILHREKANAILVATSATQELSETINEFQKQTENQRHVQNMLVDIFRDQQSQTTCRCFKLRFANEPTHH